MSLEIKLTGETTNTETVREIEKNTEGEILSDKKVQLTEGEFNEINVQCEGEVLTIRGHVTQLVRNLGVKQAVGVKMETPDGQARFISSLNSPGLDEPVPEGATFTPVYQGKAA